MWQKITQIDFHFEKIEPPAFLIFVNSHLFLHADNLERDSTADIHILVPAAGN